MPETGAQTGKDQRPWIHLLAVVLVVACGVRLWMALAFPRFFDDHYIFNNITSFLNGSLRPRHSYYGSLSYLPQAIALAVCDFLHSRTGIGALAVHGTQFEGFTLGAFRIMRLFVVGYSLVSILLMYRIGRRLFSPGAGLLAAAVLAAYPQHVRSSIQLKPDMMALMFTLAALYWTVRAAQDPKLSRYLLVGVGVGLAASAKYIGLTAALPLTAWALWAGFRDRRQWAWLPLAGVSSVVTFFVLNPFVSSVFHYAFKLSESYSFRGRAERSGHGDVLRSELEFVASQHGWILGAFLVLGTVLLIRQAWRRPEAERRLAALPVLSLLSLSLGHLAVYAAALTLFFGHNLLPAFGAMALLCAYGIDRSWEGLIRQRAALRRPAVTAVAGLLAAGFLLVRPFNYAYSQLVPDTWVLARKTLRARLAPLAARHVAHEPALDALGLSAGWQRSIRTGTPSLASLPPSLLDLADAEVFPLSRTEGPQAAFYENRRRLAGDCTVEIRPRPFHNQGMPLVLLLHPWTQAGQAVPLTVQRSGSFRGLGARLPAGLAAGEVLSIDLIRPVKGPSIPSLLLQPGGQTLPLHFAGRRTRTMRFLTKRFRYAPGTTEIQVPAPPRAFPRSYRLHLWRWTEPACP